MTLNEFLIKLERSKQRTLIRLAGAQSWAQSLLDATLALHLSELPAKQVTWFGQQAHNSNKTAEQITDLRIKKYQSLLGQETDILVIDAYAGFNPDALGALVGTVRAGGVCILITPCDDAWQTYIDPEHTRLCIEPFKPEQISHYYINRLIKRLSANPYTLSLVETDDLKTIERKIVTTFNQFNGDPNDKLTLLPVSYDEQSQLVDTITQVATTRAPSNQVVVVEADRGRGKSAALGLAAANIVANNTGYSRILLTAPKLDSVQTAFKHCRQTLTQLGIGFDASNGSLLSKHGELRFIAPDKLSLELPEADLVFVDEAAAIPSQLIKPLLSHYPKLVFATTIHGYEGTGRGFEYKFKPMLSKMVESVTYVYLTQPIRWFAGDKLELLTNDLLCIDADILDVNSFVESKHLQERVKLVKWQAAELINDELKLKQLFGLLVQAHYRTTPNDLRYLLDGPNLEVYSLELDNVSIAACLVATEGQLAPELTEFIWQGRRRPKGHLIPQSLIAHSGLKEAGQFLYGRVVRIAVPPELQNRQLGSLFISSLVQRLTEQGYDFLSTSFGATPELLRFWQGNNLQPVRLGLKPEASTGEVSVMMLRGLSNQTESWLQQAQTRFQAGLTLEHQLGWRAQQTEVVSLLLAKTEALIEQSSLNQQDLLDIRCLAHHFRGPDTCVLAVKKLLNTSSVQANLLTDKYQHGLLKQTLIEKYGFSGEKQLVQAIRQSVARLYEQITSAQ